MTTSNHDSLFGLLVVLALAIVGPVVALVSLVAWVTGTYILTDPLKPPKPPVVREVGKPWITIKLGGPK